MEPTQPSQPLQPVEQPQPEQPAPVAPVPVPEPQPQPQPSSIVEPMAIPKIELSSDKATALNAFALSFAAFFGFMTIFAAIAGFTEGSWVFNVPLIGYALANVGFASVAFISALISVAFGIIGILTLKKITDRNSIVKPWNAVSKVFLTLTIIYGVSMLALAIYALMGVGKTSGVSQKGIWLFNFLPNFITGLGAFAIYFLAKQIAAGKTALLRIFSLISLIAAGLGFILIMIQTLVGFYGNKKSSSSSSSGYDYSDILDMLR